MSHPIKEFTDEEKDIILELARMALADEDSYYEFALALDLSDEVLKDLQDRIEKVTKGLPFVED